VEVCAISKETDVGAQQLKEPYTAMKFESEVKKVQFNGNKWILGISEDEAMSIYNTETR
jgi:hypothetical protein